MEVSQENVIHMETIPWCKAESVVRLGHSTWTYVTICVSIRVRGLHLVLLVLCVFGNSTRPILQIVWKTKLLTKIRVNGECETNLTQVVRGRWQNLLIEPYSKNATRRALLSEKQLSHAWPTLYLQGGIAFSVCSSRLYKISAVGKTQT